MADLSNAHVLILATDGFEQVELFQPRQALLDAGVKVTLASDKTDPIQGMNHDEKGDTITPDMLLEMTRWASATFTGARHRILLTLPDDPLGERWLGELGEADLPIRGQLVADLATIAVTRRDDLMMVTLEALTVET